LKDVINIISSLDSEDSIKILLACEKGIEKSTEIIKKLGLTQKRYYVRLTKLIESGLVEKDQSSYRLTVLGRFCLKIVEALMKIAEQKDKLELADKMRKLLEDNKSNSLDIISKSKIFTFIDISEILYGVKIITNYDETINEIINLLNSAKESIYMVTNKIDFRVAESIFKAIKNNIRIYFLSKKKSLFGDANVQILSFLLDSEIRNFVVNFLRDIAHLKDVNFRVTDNIDFCFTIIDNKYCIIELPLIEDSNLFLALKFRNEEICHVLIKLFNDLYEKGDPDPRIEFLKKSILSLKI